MTTYTASDHTTGAQGTASAHGREGLRAGLVGATSVWAWVFVDDLVSRVPLRTPTLLGRGILSLAALGATTPAWFAAVVFTLVHYALWIGLGALAIRIVRQARRSPAVLVGAAFVMILLQFVFVDVAAIASHSRLGVLSWRDVGVGNVVGWGAMWWYIIRKHHELRAEFADASAGEDD